MPQLTIVTITYNAAKYLGRTLTSVEKALGQVSDKNWLEYLIIDGGSNDSTLKIADSHTIFIDKIISEPDRGLYDAMNKGLALASGKYIWFLNAGDEVCDEWVFKNLLTAFQSEADVYYSDTQLVREDGTLVGLRSKFTPHTLPKNLTWKDFSLGMKVSHQSFIARREKAPRYDFTNLSADIDWEINCLKKARKVQFLDFVLCKYLMGGISVQNHRRSLLDRFNVLSKHFGFLPAAGNHLFIFWRGFWFARRNGKYW